MSKETDKKSSDLYLARIEGKIIQRKDVSSNWVNLADGNVLTYTDRIRPQTLEEAGEESAGAMFINSNSNINNKNSYLAGFGDGSRWQKEQDSE